MDLLPDPDKVRVRVYESDSVHKSMSALRQGSIIIVADQDFHKVEASFKEAFFTHTSTRPTSRSLPRSTWHGGRWNWRGMSS